MARKVMNDKKNIALKPVPVSPSHWLIVAVSSAVTEHEEMEKFCCHAMDSTEQKFKTFNVVV